MTVVHIVTDLNYVTNDDKSRNSEMKKEQFLC